MLVNNVWFNMSIVIKVKVYNKQQDFFKSTHQTKEPISFHIPMAWHLVFLIDKNSGGSIMPPKSDVDPESNQKETMEVHAT